MLILIYVCRLGARKMRDRKIQDQKCRVDMQDRKMEDQKCRGGKWRTGICGTENAGPEIAELENVGPGIQI